MKRLLVCIVVLLLASCGTPEVATPAPTPQAIQVSYPVALQAWADKLSDCASHNPLMALYFTPSSTSISDISIDEIELELGEPSQNVSSNYLYQVGWEQIFVVVNQENDSNNLSTEKLRSIFSGQTSYWEDNSNQPIEVWILPDGDPARAIFDNAVIPSLSLTSDAMLAPDPQAMVEAIASKATAIGYLPQSILLSADPKLVTRLKTIQLEQTLETALHQPVIAISQREPLGQMRQLLVCLQTPAP